MTGKRPKRVQTNPKIPVSKQAAKRAKQAREGRIVDDNNNSPIICDAAPVEDFIRSLIKVRFCMYDISYTKLFRLLDPTTRLQCHKTSHY